jgi:type II secretory pathway component PulJ
MAEPPPSGLTSGDKILVGSSPRRRRVEGYMLIECLVYIAVLAVVMGVAFSAFYRCLSNSRDITRNTDDIVRALQAGEIWRADVRSAAGPLVPVESDDFSALEIPTSSGTVAYVFHDNAVWRKGSEGDAKPMLSGVKASRMVKDQRKKVVCWRWELELGTRKKIVRMRPLFTFQAVTIDR